MARYIIYGAGGVGGLIGGRLRLAGHDVILIARGAHGEAMACDGLRLKTPETDDVIKLTVVSRADEIAFRPDDAVILAMKTQGSAQALDELAALAPSEISIVCAQNGLESERMALRLFEKVYGAFVYVFGAITEPGTVSSYAFPCGGIIDVGCYPKGADTGAARIAADLMAAGFQSVARADIMTWKRGKLLLNSANAIRAACPPRDPPEDIITAAKEEAERCFLAARVDFVSDEEITARGKELFSLGKVDGRPFPGGSTTQDLARGNASSEVDYLNGEVTLLGRLLDIPTPVSIALQEVMRELLRRGAPPGSMSAAELRQRVRKAL